MLELLGIYNLIFDFTERRRSRSRSQAFVAFEEIEPYVSDFLRKYENAEANTIPLYISMLINVHVNAMTHIYQLCCPEKRSYSRTDLCWSTLSRNTVDAARGDEALQGVPMLALSAILNLCAMQMDASVREAVIDAEQNLSEDVSHRIEESFQ